ncbi:MAG: hypothetical protein JO337_12270 [Acidimicrobiales bacterium]|nr:hypothetical protein [Acidimicrobiales bacterium]
MAPKAKSRPAKKAAAVKAAVVKAAVKSYRDTPPEAHEWLTFDDPAELRTWAFDVTFLTSGWECIFGRGCQGVLTGPAPQLEQGCCSYGAHFTDRADAARVRKAARTLTADEWQFAAIGRKGGVVTTEPDGTLVTRMVEDACIFLNRPGFAAGAGCALHQAALRRGNPPLEMKPDVCWQLPLRREDSTDESTGRVTSTVGQWDRRHWGGGGEEFHWWCTEAPEAFGSRRAVYQTMESELRALVGDAVYDRLVAYLEVRTKGSAVPLPHPVLRQRR